MKVLHVAMARVPSSGIVRQMLGEQQAAIENNLPWMVNIFVSNEDDRLIKNSAGSQNDSASVLATMPELKNTWLGFRLSFYKWLLQKEKDFDVVLLRYSSYDPLLYWYLSKTNKSVYLVHHTLEGSELLLEKGFLNKLKAIAEMVIGPFSMRKSKAQIGVTKEILDYEQRRSRSTVQAGFVYPNGLKVDKEMLVQDDRSRDTPRLLFVASDFFPWHGLDLLLDSIAKSNKLFRLDIVGHVSEADKISASKDNRIFLHGHLPIKEIKKLAAQADVGLSSFALDRKKMKQACTLKVREYLAMGLPVYSGHDDVFPASFEVYKNDACEIDGICSYAMRMKSVPRATVASAAKKFIDKKLLLQKLYEQIAVENKAAND